MVVVGCEERLPHRRSSICTRMWDDLYVQHLKGEVEMVRTMLVLTVLIAALTLMVVSTAQAKPVTTPHIKEF